MNTPGSYTISTDKQLLDVEMIHDFLSNRSYWGQGRSMETVRKSIAHSLCFGVYSQLEGKQAGFARIITDFTIFAWVLDVFILEEYRGNGLGKQLMQFIRHYPELAGVKRWMLATKDAHGLYGQYGFRELARPELFMEHISV